MGPPKFFLFSLSYTFIATFNFGRILKTKFPFGMLPVGIELTGMILTTPIFEIRINNMIRMSGFKPFPMTEGLQPERI